MNSIQSIRRTFGIVVLALCGFCATAQAQTIGEIHADALEKMKTGKWAEAHGVLARATDLYDARALKLFGPSFGWFWYHRGYCELKLNQFDEAINSFNKCYKDYKNTDPKPGQAPGRNLYNKRSLLMMGHAAKGAEEWRKSIQMYEKFLKERDPTRDSYEKGVFYINLAICNYKLKKIADGNKNFEIAIKGKISFPTPNKGIMSAFSALVESAIEKKDEKALLKFLAENRGHIKLEPFEAHEFTPLFMKLAQDARSAEMIRSAFELYALVPSTVGAVDDIQARLAMVGAYPRTINDGSMVVNKGELQKSLDDLKKKDRTGKVNEIYVYLNTAFLHEQNGNIRGAFAVYEQLELYFPKAKVEQKKETVKMREDNLFHLVRTSSALGEVFTTEHYGSIFIKDFPDSKHIPIVRRMMLTSLFFNGEYEKCIEVAEVMLPKLTSPSVQHDVCLFALGGSKHYLGEFADAQPLLDEYISTYKKSKEADDTRVQATTYFQAANRSRLQEWTKSATLLDSFLKEYSDPNTNVYYPFALFDRASCHYAEEEFEEAYKAVTTVETDFPGVSVMESNLALKGNICESMERAEEAEEYYLKALALAESKKARQVASECLFYLTALVGREQKGKENPRLEEAVPYYDKFWNEYSSDSPFKAKTAVAGIPAMRKAGRIDEALEKLQTVIADLAKVPGTPGLEGAIGSYTEEYLKENTPEELKNHYYDFPRIDARDKATRALLRIAIIDVFDGVLADAKKEKDENKARSAQSNIDLLFKELRDAYQPKDLSNFILVKVGNFIRTKTSQPERAREYYEEALNRKEDQSHKFSAIFGLADVNAKGTKAQKQKAISLLQQVIADSDDKGEKDEATYLTAQIQKDNGDGAAAVKTALGYIENKKFRKYNLACRMMIAQIYDEDGKVEDAIGMYTQVWGGAMGNFKYSAPAIKRWMEIVWNRDSTNKNGITDRQYAYVEGHRYLSLTKNALKKATPEERENVKLVEELVKSYEANSDTDPIKEK